MRHRLLSLVLVAFTGPAAAEAILETSGTQRDAWDILDFTGDANITVVEDTTTPPGYGPEVLTVSGDHVLALAKTPARRDGTYTILYREMDPEGKDADGILVFGAQYGDDISTAHNTKQRLPHAWLEQDNDSGLHIRSVGANGDETIVTQAPGVGLVDDPWNITGWIWQQVQIDGDTLRAKYWPAHTPEPEAWNLETEWPEMKAGRVGFRIGSGDIHVAHFAVHDTRAPILPPEAWLVPVNDRVVSSAGIALNLFLRDGLEETSPATLTLRGPEDLVRELDMMISPPATPGPITLRLTDEPEEKVNQAPLPKLLPTGHFTISIQLPDKDFAAGTTIEILDTDELDARIRDLGENIETLEDGGWFDLVKEEDQIDLTFAMSSFPSIDKTHATAAKRLHGLAVQQRNSGHLESCAINLDRAENAARASAYNAATPATFKGRDMPTESLETLHAPSQKAIQSIAPEIRTSYNPIDNPLSLAAGHTHTFEFQVAKLWSGNLKTNLGLRLMLMHAVSRRVVAQSIIRSKLPIEEWGKEFRTWRVELELPHPEDVEKPANPVIQDGWHQLCLQWIDLDTGDSLLQDKSPNLLSPLYATHDAGMPGLIQPIADFYVSTEPVFLMKSALSYVGQGERDYTVVLRAKNLEQNGFTRNIDKVTFFGKEAHELAPEVREAQDISVWRENRLVTRFSPKTRHIPWVKGAPTVVRDANGEFKTQLTVQEGLSGTISVFFEGQQIAASEYLPRSSEPTPLLVEPHIGYYDVALTDSTGRTSHTRLIATVVETDGTDILVNGEPFLIKGLNVHGLDGQSPARTRAMMKIFRDLGFNMLRGDYPPYWQMDMAVEENLGWSVLAPFSIVSTDELATERYIGPAFTAAREQTRAFVERYRDSAGVFLWNSANEIQGDITDFLINVKPVYEHHDPMKRPVHYANLYGQDRFDGQDAVGVNYYFGPGETPESRHPMILKNIETAKALGKPLFYTEYNAYEGAIHATGVEAMEGLFEWGVEQGMAGGFFYFRFNSERHPGVIDQGYNTHVLLNDALRKAFNDAEVTLAGATADTIDLHIRNRRRFTLRKVQLTLAENPDAVLTLEDFPPKTERTITLNRANNLENGVYLEGVLRFETHHGFHEKVAFTVMQPGK